MREKIKRDVLITDEVGEIFNFMLIIVKASYQ
jgi:hypothetical protein